MSSPSNFGSTSSTTGSRDIPEHSRRRDDHHASCPGRRVSGADRLSRARGNRDKPHLCAGFTLEQVEHSLFGFRAHALNGFDPSSPVLTTVWAATPTRSLRGARSTPSAGATTPACARRRPRAPQRPDRVRNVGLVRIRLQAGRGHSDRPSRFQDTQQRR